MTLEEIAKGEKASLPRRMIGYVAGAIKSKEYWIDTAAGSSFWTPLLAANEFYQGMDCSEVAKARGIGVLVGACINRPILKLRDYWSKKVWGVEDNSSKGKKILADLSLGLIAVPTIYGGVLLSSGQDLETIKEVLPSGAAIQLGTGMIYVKYADFIRKTFGSEENELPKLILEE